MIPHTFDVSRMPTHPISLPPQPSMLSIHPNPILSRPIRLPSQRLGNNAVSRDEVKAEPESRPGVYEKYFNKDFGTGKYFTKKTFGGWFGPKTPGLKTNLNRFRRDRSGKGRNLTKQDIEVISGEFEKTLEDLPTHMCINGRTEHIPLRAQKRLRMRLWKDMKEGKIDKTDLEDAKRIIKNIEV